MFARVLIGLVKAYRFFLSPALGSSCRFEPSCSTYALQALQLHGAGQGGYLVLRRLGRCHPWCDGGLDSVPAPNCASASSVNLFSRLLSLPSKKKSS